MTKVQVLTASFVGSLLFLGATTDLRKEQPLREEAASLRSVDDSLRVEVIKDTIYIERNTAYHPVASQCQGNPLVTADMSRINITKLKNEEVRWIALSRDLIARWGGPIEYGDTVEVLSEVNPQLNGEWVLHDCMNARYENSVDFLFHPENNSGIIWPEKTDLKIIY